MLNCFHFGNSSISGNTVHPSLVGERIQCAIVARIFQTKRSFPLENMLRSFLKSGRDTIMFGRETRETIESKARAKAAQAIQRFYRRHITRLNNIPISEAKSTHVFVPPNNPVLLLEKYRVKPKEQVVLVGISGLPAVEMSCRLSNDAAHSPVPKIFIIDYNNNRRCIYS